VLKGDKETNWNLNIPLNVGIYTQQTRELSSFIKFACIHKRLRRNLDYHIDKEKKKTSSPPSPVHLLDKRKHYFRINLPKKLRTTRSYACINELRHKRVICEPRHANAPSTSHVTQTRHQRATSHLSPINLPPLHLLRRLPLPLRRFPAIPRTSSFAPKSGFCPWCCVLRGTI